MKKALMALAIVAIVAIAAMKLMQFSKGTSMWFQGSDRKQLEKILGPESAPFLEGAEIAAWAPDPNYKAQSYYVVRAMTVDEARKWATVLQVTLTNESVVAPSEWSLPEGVKARGWLSSGAAMPGMLEGRSSGAKAIASVRWADGATYTVVSPKY